MLSTRVRRFVCRVVVLALLFGGLISCLLWFTLRPRVPGFQIHEFAIHGMSRPAGFVNSQITYNVTIRNRNRQTGIEYHYMFGTVLYKDELLGSNQTISPFYQEAENTTTVYEVVRGATMTKGDTHWAEFNLERARGLVVFRLEMTSKVRFSENTWKRKHHRMRAKCHVEVNSDGILLPYPESGKCSAHLS